MVCKVSMGNTVVNLLKHPVTLVPNRLQPQRRLTIRFDLSILTLLHVQTLRSRKLLLRGSSYNARDGNSTLMQQILHVAVIHKDTLSLRRTSRRLYSVDPSCLHVSVFSRFFHYPAINFFVIA